MRSFGTSDAPPTMYRAWLLAISSSLMSQPFIPPRSSCSSTVATSVAREVVSSWNERNTCALSGVLYRYINSVTERGCMTVCSAKKLSDGRE